MANLKNIRSQIKSVTSIQKVTKAMKMVAAAKLRKSQDNMEKARPYSERLKSLITDLIQDVDRALMPLLTKRDNINKTAFVIVTADRGLAGSFNTNIIKKAEKEIKQVGKENAELFCLGKKGYEHFSKRNYKINKNYTDFWTQLNYNKAIKLKPGFKDAYHNLSNTLTDYPVEEYTNKLAAMYLDILDLKTIVRPIEISRAIISFLKCNRFMKVALNNVYNNCAALNISELCIGLAKLPLFVKILSPCIQLSFT